MNPASMGSARSSERADRAGMGPGPAVDAKRSNSARSAAWVLIAAASVAGAWLSWDFGFQLGGVFMGLVVATNGALISALLAGAVLDRVMPNERG